MKGSEKDFTVKVEDEEDIKKLCSDTWERLYRFVYFKVQNREEAEDITQETYIKAISYIKQNNVSIDKVISFLKAVSVNVLRDKWRKNKRQGIAINLDEINPEEISIEDYTENIAQREIIQNALNSLNEEQRNVIELRILKGYSVKDTAKKMNITESNVRVLQFRAMQKLTHILKNEH
jgi:RNA polymerase sigma-70 factor, ECF subfamily